MLPEKVIAIIPARGGSKRIPRKNIVDFRGKPLIAWTIEEAQRSGIFHRVVVSTDDLEIAEIAEKYGAQAPFMRDQAADDISPVSLATLRTLEQLKQSGEEYQTVVQLFAVCPLRTATDIRAAYQFHLHRQEAFVISCHRYVGMNPWWAAKLDAECYPAPLFENTRIRSQDLPILYCPTGAIWIANVRRLFEERTFYGAGHLFWEMDWSHAVDIDTFDDLQLAKALKCIQEYAE